jgi:hypothetical protein
MPSNISRQILTFFFPPLFDSSKPLYYKVLRELPLILVLTAITFCLHHAGLFKLFENTNLDSLLRLNPISPQETILVDINDADYKNPQLFNARSPLNAQILDELLEDISAAAVKAIVVDIDTSDKSFLPLKDQKKHPYHGKNIIWGEAASSWDDSSGTTMTPANDDELPPLVPAGVLGSVDSKNVNAGIAVMTPDRDGILRDYPRTVKLVVPSTDAAGHVQPLALGSKETLPWKCVVEVAANSVESKTPKDNMVLFRFSFDANKYPGFSAGDVLQMCKSRSSAFADLAQDKIVLVGGTYGAARDRYATPIGPVDGLKLIGFAIETHLQNKEIKEPPAYAEVFADIACGVLFMIASCLLSGQMLLLVALPLGMLLAFVASLLTFNYGSMWVNFVPIVAGIFIHQMGDHIKEHKHLLHEVKDLKNKLSKYESPE